jgi:hypothetical protein
MFKTDSNINVTIFKRDHSIGNGVEKYTLALGSDLGDMVDYIIKENDFNDAEQQQFIDQMIHEGIEALHDATKNEIDDQYINYLCTSSLYSVEKKRTHLLNYKIDKKTLGWCDLCKKMLYLAIKNKKNKSISYQKIFIKEGGILAFLVELDDDLQKKVEYAKEVVEAYDDLNESELLELAIIHSIEQRYIETLKPENQYLEHAQVEEIYL